MKQMIFVVGMYVTLADTFGEVFVPPSQTSLKTMSVYQVREIERYNNRRRIFDDFEEEWIMDPIEVEIEPEMAEEELEEFNRELFEALNRELKKLRMPIMFMFCLCTILVMNIIHLILNDCCEYEIQ